mgnify:CR=1 FL=1
MALDTIRTHCRQLRLPTGLQHGDGLLGKHAGCHSTARLQRACDAGILHDARGCVQVGVGGQGALVNFLARAHGLDPIHHRHRVRALVHSHHVLRAHGFHCLHDAYARLQGLGERDSLP